mgnify:CR=1 FL=1
MQRAIPDLPAPGSLGAVGALTRWAACSQCVTHVQRHQNAPAAQASAGVAAAGPSTRHPSTLARRRQCRPPRACLCLAPLRLPRPQPQPLRFTALSRPLQPVSCPSCVGPHHTTETHIHTQCACILSTNTLDHSTDGASGTGIHTHRDRREPLGLQLGCAAPAA